MEFGLYRREDGGVGHLWRGGWRMVERDSQTEMRIGV